MNDEMVDMVDVLNESAGPSSIWPFTGYLGSYHTFHWAQTAAEKSHFWS